MTVGWFSLPGPAAIQRLRKNVGVRWKGVGCRPRPTLASTFFSGYSISSGDEPCTIRIRNRNILVRNRLAKKRSTCTVHWGNVSRSHRRRSMNHYRSRHSPHDRQPEQGVFSIECLDPQLDSLVDTISREVAAHQPVVLLKGIHSVEEQAKFEMERSEANASLQWSKYTSSLLLGVGLLGICSVSDHCKSGVSSLTFPYW